MQSMKSPKLTIITPSYNQGQFLEQTILSVLDQEYPNLEYIIIDGGSSDNSVEIIKKYEHRLAYWVSEKDRGQTHAINKGLSIATGDIVGWINSDDKYVPGSFRRIIHAFLGDEELILVHGERIIIDEDSMVAGWTRNSPFDPLKTNFNICSETAFWRSSKTKDLKLKEELRFAMDLEFFCRLYLMGKIKKLGSYIGCFRCYSGNKSSTIPQIGEQEASAEWMALFGAPLQAKMKSAGKLNLLMAASLNPILIGWPYFKRRFLSRQRGLKRN